MKTVEQIIEKLEELIQVDRGVLAEIEKSLDLRDKVAAQTILATDEAFMRWIKSDG